MRRIRRFLRARDGAVTVEWVAVTFALLAGAAFVVYELSAGGLNPVREELNSDLDRVRITPDD